jgi:FtsP/CotA-like multicopper oxidase with cupredoxin domain
MVCSYSSYAPDSHHILSLTLGDFSPGEFPGPTIEARSGDVLHIDVQNDLSDEGVTLHWHGLKLLGQNLFDGVVGFTQCPIPAGKSFTYSIQIGDQEYGTFWWHAHSQVQRGDGIFGGLVIHQPVDGDTKLASDLALYSYDRDVLLMIGDWYHASAIETLKWVCSIF